MKEKSKKNNSNLSCSDDNPNQRNHQQLQHWLNAPTTWPSKETSLPSELLPEPTFNLQRFTNEIVLLKEQIQDLPAEIEAIKHSMTEQMYSSNKSLIDMNGNTEPEYCVNIWVKMGQSWGKCITKTWIRQMLIPEEHMKKGKSNMKPNDKFIAENINPEHKY